MGRGKVYSIGFKGDRVQEERGLRLGDSPLRGGLWASKEAQGNGGHCCLYGLVRYSSI